MDDYEQYKPTSPLKGVWLFFSKQRYLDAAFAHSVWLELQQEDLQEDRRQKFLEGTYPSTPDASKNRKRELQRYESLRDQFRDSFIQVASVTVLAALIDISIGSIDGSLSFHPAKGISLLGTFLVAWAALFELGGPRLASWDGKTLSEIVHPKIFQIMFIPGSFALMCSILL
jgi:hypothetical protein